MVALVLVSSTAHAQQVIPSATLTVRLQDFPVPAGTPFQVPQANRVEATSGNGIEGDGSRGWTLTSAGLIRGVVGVALAGSGNSLTNTGTISGTGGTAISFGGGSNTLTLGSGSLLNGNVVAAGSGNQLSLQGSGGVEDSSFTGFDSLAVTGDWTLTGVTTGLAGGTSIGTGARLQLGTDPAFSYGITGRLRSAMTVGKDATLYLGGTNVLGYGSTRVTAITLNGANLVHAGIGDNGWGIGYVLNGATMQSTSTGAFSFGGQARGSDPDNTSVRTLASPNPSVIAGKITLREGGGGVDANRNFVNFTVDDGAAANDLLVSASIAENVGNHAIVKLGAGTMTLTGTNSFTGGTTITAGTLQVGDGGTSGSLMGDIANAAALVFNRSDASTFAGVISGGGSFTKQGTGTLTLSGANTYTATTTLAGGTLRAGNANALAASGGVTFAAAGTLDLGGFDLSVARLDSAVGADRVVALGGNTLTLTGAGVPAGTTPSYGGTFSGTGQLVKNGAHTQRWILPGNATINSTINAGVLDLTTNVISGGGFQLGGSIVDNAELHFSSPNAAGTFYLDADVSGSGRLVQDMSGNAALALTGDATHTGGTVIENGPLWIGNGGTSGSLSSDVLLNSAAASLVYYRTDAQDFAGVISGTGSLSVGRSAAGGVLTLTGNSTYSGPTTVAPGYTLVLTSPARIGSLTALGANRGTYRLTGSMTLPNAISLAGAQGVIIDTDGSDDVLTGAISGNGRFRKHGAGTLTLATAKPAGAFPLIIHGGTLAVGDAGDINGNDVQDGAILAFDRSDTYTYTGVISDSPADSTVGFGAQVGALRKEGAGTLVLTRDHSFTGGTTIAAGTLQLGTGGSSGSVVGDIADDGSLVFNRGNALTYAGNVSGNGSLVQAGAGELKLTGTHAYQGGTTINSGRVLHVGTGGATGSVVGDIANNGTLIVNRSGVLAFDGVISGSGNLVKRGTGELQLGGANTFVGTTRVEQGVLSVGQASNFGQSGNALIFDGGTLRWRSAFSLSQPTTLLGGGGSFDSNGLLVEAATAISGTGGLGKTGAGTLVLSGNNTYTGTTTVGAGTLQVGGGATSGNIASDVVNHGILAFDRSDSLVFARQISGQGEVHQLGSGVLTFSTDQRYTGPTVVSAGTLQLGNGGAAGGVDGDMVNNAAVVFDHGASSNGYAGVISGSGTLSKLGAGTLTLAGDNSYTGLTSIGSGRLLVTGSIDGDVQVSSGATLGGTGTAGGIGSTVTVGNGGRLAPGTSPGTLNIGGALFLDPGAQLDYELGLAGVVGGSQNDLVNVGGNLTLDGTLNLANVGGMAPGVYRLFNYAGSLQDNGLAIGAAVPTRFLPSDFLVDVSVAGQVNLLAQSGGFALQFWDGANVTPNAVVDGGTGTWTQAPSNWTGVDGALNAGWQGGFAIFGATPGTITLGEDITLQGMQFRSTGYRIDGAGHVLAGEPQTIVNVDTLVTATLDAPLVDGAGGPTELVKAGAGLLILGGSSSYSGGTQINNGAVQVASDANLGAASGSLGLDSALLITTASFASARPVTVGANGGGFATEGSTTLTLTGAISGPGVLSKVGTGTLVLSGNNSYEGGTFIGSGVLQASAEANLGASTAALEIAGGTFQLGASFDLARPVTLGELGGIFDTQGFTSTVAQPVLGLGALDKRGTGRLILAGDAAYGGSTTIRAGTLQLGNGGRAGSVRGDIVDDGALVVDRSDTFVLSSQITGTGSLTQAGSGALVLTADHGYTGGTSVAAGVLQLGNGGDTGSVLGDIANQGTLVFDHAGDRLFAGVISGTGALTKRGANSLTLTANNPLSGTTTIEDGVLRLGGGGNTGSVAGPVANAGELAFDRSDNWTFAGPISGSGSVRQAGIGTLTLAGANTYTGGTFLDAGVLSVAADGALGDSSGPLDFDGGTLQLTAAFDSARPVALASAGGTIDAATRNGWYGSLSGVGALTKSGAGTLVLAADNSYSGGTHIAAGTLQLGDGGSTGSVTGDIFNQGALVVARSDVYSLDGVVTGSGSLTQAGPGTLVLGSEQGYTGGTTITAGTLQLGDGGDSGSVLGDIVDNGTLVFDHAGDRVFSGVISGSGGLTKVGTNTLILTADNRFAGTTTITAGAIQLGNGGSSGGLLGPVVNQGALVMSRGGTVQLDGPISGSGYVLQQGTGTVVLAGDNTYGGGTFIDAGVLAASADNNLGAADSPVVFDGGALQLTAAFDSARPLVLEPGGGTLDIAARNKFSGSLTGAGTLTKTGSGALILNADASYTGAMQVMAGSFVVGDSQHPQARLSGGGAVWIDTGAAFGGYGTVVGNVDNRGILGVGNALAALAGQPDAEFNIAGNLANAGAVTLVNGVPADRLNIAGTYIANGGTLQLEAVLDQGGPSAQADRLVAGAIERGSGPTGIVVHPLGGAGAFTVGDGIQLVDVLDSTRSAPGAFVLAQRVVAGPHEYLLYQGGLNNPDNGDWYLRNTRPEVVDPTPSAIFRPEVGAYLGNREAATGALVHTLHQRLGEARYPATPTEDGSLLDAAWLRIRAVQGDSSAAGQAVDIDSDRSLLQAGVDVAQWNLLGGDDQLHLGGMLGYARSDARATAQFNPAAARARSEGTTAGVYATWFAHDEQRMGAYVDAWMQYGWFDDQVRGQGLPSVDYDADAWALSLEYGYAMAAGPRWVIEPQLQLVYDHYDTDPISESNGTRVRPADKDQVLSRVGVRVYPFRERAPDLQPFLALDWWHGDATGMAFDTLTVDDDVPDDRYAVTFGVQGMVSARWAVWTELGGEWGGGGYKQVNGQIGARYSW